jgi:HSP20 family protein
MSEEKRGREMTAQKSNRDLQQAMNEMEETYEEVFGRPFFPVSLGREPEVRSWSPATEIYDNIDYYIVRLEVPGVNKEDINVTATEDSVTISGNRKQEKGIEGEKFTLCERCYGPFIRILTFESAIEPDGINAWLENGILRLEIPISREEMGKKIEITSGEQQNMGRGQMASQMRPETERQIQAQTGQRMTGHTPGPQGMATDASKPEERNFHTMEGHSMKVISDMVDEASTGRLSLKDTIDVQEKAAQILTDSGRPLRNKDESPKTSDRESQKALTREEEAHPR